jgi:uncharacterized transporter YbjL
VEFVRTLLEQQPLMTLFLTIAIGYLVGEINIKGFSLGVGAVLFVALAVGWFAPKSVPAPMVGTLGLALFLYAVGVQYGKQFFLGLKSPAGRKQLITAGMIRQEPDDLFEITLSFLVFDVVKRIETTAPQFFKPRSLRIR